MYGCSWHEMARRYDLRGALQQACRDCGELFPYDETADYCPSCVAEQGYTPAELAAWRKMDRGA